MTRLARLIPLSLFALACSGKTPPPEQDQSSMGAGTMPTDPIEVAMDGAPEAIAVNAAIITYDSLGQKTQLRPGTNGWACLPDSNPAAEGYWPMCLDSTWQQWIDAWMAKRPPKVFRVGISYMLKGGPVASNTDPFALTPATGEEWVMDGPHLMVVVPEPSQLDAFPTDPKSGGPYVMWKGTPYAHLMVPIGGS